ncbi:MAG: DUF4058 family protein [Planctomycetes bacterium]|nr:DUF4058 family protein [Planctomycetota bacterium]
MPIHDWSRVDPGVFHDFHLIWIARLRNVLNAEVLPRPFYAHAEPVVGEAEPDLITLQAQAGAAPSSSEGPDDHQRRLFREEGGASAVALAPFPVQVQEITPEPYARRARQIVIKDAWQGDAVVAVIELVSPGNKSSQARAEQFVRKSEGFLERRIHLVILDLHRPTNIVPSGFHARIWEDFGHEPPGIPPDRALSAVSYEVLEDGTLRAYFAALKVQDPLPQMPVFLRPHEYVRLPLEATYNECFRDVTWRFREILERPEG